MPATVRLRLELVQRNTIDDGPGHDSWGKEIDGNWVELVADADTDGPDERPELQAPTHGVRPAFPAELGVSGVERLTRAPDTTGVEEDVRPVGVG